MNSAGPCLSPRESGEFIAANAKDVTISAEGVKNTVQHIISGLKQKDPLLLLGRWAEHPLNVKTMDKAAIDWIFLADVGNFSFWSDDETKKYCVRYKGETYTGYWAWVAAINRALDEGIPLTDPAYYKDLTQEQLKQLLRSDSKTEMPLLEERLQVLQEAGQIICQKYEGSFLTMIKQCEGSAQNLLNMIVKNIPSFKDEALFDGHQVAIYKRAQILIADVWACCGGEGYGRFNDIDSLTMFADYRIPQALVWFGALKYSDVLMQELQKGKLFKSGDRQEVEIRGCTIKVVEDIVAELRKRILLDPEIADDTVINAIVVDHYLWDYRRAHTKKTEHIPIHKIRCIYY